MAEGAPGFPTATGFSEKAWEFFLTVTGGGLSAIYLALIQGVSVFNPLLVGVVATVSALLFIGVSRVTKPHPGAIDFAAELREELDRHRAW